MVTRYKIYMFTVISLMFITWIIHKHTMRSIFSLLPLKYLTNRNSAAVIRRVSGTSCQYRRFFLIIFRAAQMFLRSQILPVLPAVTVIRYCFFNRTSVYPGDRRRPNIWKLRITIFFSGNDEGSSILMRVFNSRTRAPTFNRRSRIVSKVAFAKDVAPRISVFSVWMKT